MLDEAPTFEIYYTESGKDIIVKDKYEFHKHIIEYIDLRLSDNFASHNPEDFILCFFRTESDINSIFEAKLEQEGFVKSLNSCLDYFTEIEEHERCEKIIKLQTQLNKN